MIYVHEHEDLYKIWKQGYLVYVFSRHPSNGTEQQILRRAMFQAMCLTLDSDCMYGPETVYFLPVGMKEPVRYTQFVKDYRHDGVGWRLRNG